MHSKHGVAARDAVAGGHPPYTYRIKHSLTAQYLQRCSTPTAQHSVLWLFLNCLQSPDLKATPAGIEGDTDLTSDESSNR